MLTTPHTLFEIQYTELALAVDEIAERIRALGAVAPGSYSAFAALARVEEAQRVPKAVDMIRALVEDQATVVAAAGEVVGAAGAHEKNSWMLARHLE